MKLQYGRNLFNDRADWRTAVMRPALSALGLAACLATRPALALDCAQAKARPDRLICTDTTLGRADAAMADAYDALRRGLPPAERRGLLADQRQWLAERASCVVNEDGGTASDSAALACMQRDTGMRLRFLSGDAPGGGPRILPRFLYRPAAADRYAVEIAYPEIQHAETPGLRAANALLRRNLVGTWATPRSGAGDHLAYAARYRVTRLTAAFASVAVSTYRDDGGAYPTTGGESLNLDLGTGRLLPLSALLRPDAPETAARLCTAQLSAYYSKALGSPWAPDAAAVAAIAKDGGNWSFLPGRATLAFREGSLGPHALSAYDCRIEGPSFAGLVQPGGPLADP